MAHVGRVVRGNSAGVQRCPMPGGRDGEPPGRRVPQPYFLPRPGRTGTSAPRHDSMMPGYSPDAPIPPPAAKATISGHQGCTAPPPPPRGTPPDPLPSAPIKAGRYARYGPGSTGRAGHAGGQGERCGVGWNQRYVPPEFETSFPNGPAASRPRSARAFQGLVVRGGPITITVMDLVAGVDSSTRSTKVVLCRADNGAVVGSVERAAPGRHRMPPGPLVGGAGLGRARAPGAGGRDRRRGAAARHGGARLRGRGHQGRDALERREVRAEAAELVPEFGGAAEWAARTGSVPTMSFTVTKLRWLAENEPANAARVHRVVLPHDWLTWRLAGGGPGAGASVEPTTDRGDASGTGYFSAEGAWLPEYAARALGGPVALPPVAAPSEVVGRTSWGAALSAGTGDNMAAALGLGLAEGDVAVSIGTSGTASRSPPRSPPTRPGWSAASPTRPGGSCRWPARSTRPGCST